MNKILSLLLLLSLSLAGFAQKSPEQTGGVYYAYPQTSTKVAAADIPDGFEPFYVSHYGRHGSRWLTSDARYQWVLDHFADDSNLTRQGRSVKKRLAKVWQNAKGNGGQLTPIGEAQHRGIAHRMLQRFPWLQTDGTEVEARSSVVNRCRKSMEAFVGQLQSETTVPAKKNTTAHSTMSITTASDTADMRWMSFDSPELKQLQLSTSVALGVSPDRLMSALFVDPSQVESPANLFTELHTIAADLQDVEGVKVNLFDIFTTDELMAAYHKSCASMWHENGYDPLNHGIPAQTAANLWNNIATEADKAIAHHTAPQTAPSATLRFGHDTGLYRLLSLLGVSYPLTAEGTGQLDEIVPMAANLQMAFVRNNSQVLVALWLNEKPLALPSLKAAASTADGQQWYDWTDVKAHYQPFVDRQRWIDRTANINTMVGTDYAVTRAPGRYGKGSEEHGQTLPAVQEPHGQTSWTPQTQATEVKCIAPYYYRDTLWQGFRASHWLVGGCTQDYGSFTLQPMMGQLRLKADQRATRFSHDGEESHPYYYRVDLPDEHLRAEMTATSHAAIFRFTPAEDGQMHIVVEPNSDEREAFIEVDTLRRIVWGYNPVHRIYQGWGERAGFNGWFVVEFDRPISLSGVRDTVAYVSLDVHRGEQVMVRAASSFTSKEGAEHNLCTEIPSWDFLATRLRLDSIWQAQLQKVDIETADERDAAKFYGALYRSLILPREMSDAPDGSASPVYSYPTFATADSVSNSPRPIYGDFSMWDIYRAQLPLLQIIEPQQTADMMQSLVCMASEGGWMPIFPCWNSYTAAMIGDHGASALADAWIKAPGSFDGEKAYQALRRNAFESPATVEEYRDGMGRRALESYLHYGYIPLEDSVPDAFHTKEQVSRTLEYAYDDYCLAQMAKSLGHEADYQELMRRSANWKNVINPNTGWADARRENGSWLGNEDLASRMPFITEGAVMHYSFYVPHDTEGLAEAMGGREVFEAKLDELFGDLVPRCKADADAGIRTLEHRPVYYWHGNEPCHQIPYLYALVSPWKTQHLTRQILDTEYLDVPGGLSGNDDAGQMSAWQVFTSLGFYPVCPSTPRYYLTAPSFRRAQIGQFVIEAPEASRENIYIQSITWNGQPWTKPWITHDMITQGGTLYVELGNKPSDSWTE